MSRIGIAIVVSLFSCSEDLRSNLNGMPSQDPAVESLRTSFQSSTAPTSVNDLSLGRTWTCRFHATQLDNFDVTKSVTFAFIQAAGGLYENTGTHKTYYSLGTDFMSGVYREQSTTFTDFIGKIGDELFVEVVTKPVEGVIMPTSVARPQMVASAYGVCKLANELPPPDAAWSCAMNDDKFHSTVEGCFDSYNQLVWFKPDYEVRQDLDDPSEKCAELIHEGFDDWRLPSTIELRNVAGRYRAMTHFKFNTNRFFYSAELQSNKYILVELKTGSAELSAPYLDYPFICVRSRSYL